MLLLAPNGQVHTAKLHVTPVFAIGFAMAVCGTIIRWKCYRTLGHRFTFRLTIRKDHELCTEGPYSIVRHPSYAAAFLYSIGHNLCHLGTGSWWMECGVWSTTAGKVIGCLLLMWHVVIVPAVLKRCKVEDEVLKQVFGEQWIEWSKKTPYAVLPYVY